MKLRLIDASSMIYRAFYSLPHDRGAGLRNPQGEPIGAVYGLTRMLLAFAKRIEEGDAVAAVFDAHKKGASFRNAIDPNYKAGRKSNGELAQQFAPCREAAAVMGFNPVSVDGFEADDVIASYTWAPAAIEICSPDKDLLCLMHRAPEYPTTIYDPMRNNRNGAIVTEEDVFKKWGVHAELMPDLLALTGDAADNIEGVPGIGTKTAAMLLNRFGDLDCIFRNLALVNPPRLQAVLRAHEAQARKALELVTLKTDIPLPVPIAALRYVPPEPEAVRAFCLKHGFISVLNDMGLAA